MSNLVQDISYGLRTLRRSPGFAAVAVLSLALGIGANTAIFSVIDAVVLRDLPVADPGRLVQFRVVTPGESRMARSLTYAMFRELRDRAEVFSGVFAVADGPSFVEVDGRSERVSSVYVSGGFFPTLGVGAIAGRTLGPEDDRPEATPAIMISHGFWERRLGLDPTALDRTVIIEGVPCAIAGVTPSGFSGVDVGASPDIYVPVALEPRTRPRQSWLGSPHARWLRVVARLAPGITLTQARAHLAAISPGIMAEVTLGLKEYRTTMLASRFDVDPAPNGLARLRVEFSEPLRILAAAVGLVLLLACVNIANLLLSRSGARQREIAVRLAIGASRRRIVRQLLSESVLLGLAGGTAGLLVASWGSEILVALMAGDLVLDLRLDPRVLAFTLSVSFLTGIAFGLAPALRATRLDLTPSLKEGKQGAVSSRQPLGRALVVAQVALSLVLVTGAWLFGGTLRSLLAVDAGFDRERILLANINASRSGYQGERLAAFFDEALRRVRALPGVRAVSVSWAPPVTGDWGSDGPFSVEGYTPAQAEKLVAYTNWVGPGLFATLGTPLRVGREFEARDRRSKPQPIIINETMARRYWPGSSAVGKSVRTYDEAGPRQVVGVVADLKYMTLREPTPPTIYFPFSASSWDRAYIVVRTDDPRSTSLATAVRREIEGLGPRIDVGTRTMSEHVNRSLTRERLVAALSGFFGALALALAAIGLYGVMACSVSRRTSEIGIRMALGARPADVQRQVLGEALGLALAGTVLGVPAALMAARAVSGTLFGVTARDPAVFAAAAAVLVAVAALAAFLPARRAAKVDPMIALRYE